MVSKTIAKLCKAVLALTLVGCSSLSPATPTELPSPTTDSQATMNALSNSVAQTIYADLTQNAPTITPTYTETATLTATATETAGPSLTPTHAFIPWSATPTPTQAAYSCLVTNISPSASTKIDANTEFDAEWTVQNTGYATWSDDNTDVRYIEGEVMQTNGDAVDLNRNVTPGSTVTVAVDMQTPDGDGTYTATWGMYLEDGSICYLYLSVKSIK